MLNNIVKMKYPAVILFRYEKYKDTIDDYFKQNESILDCNINITSDPAKLQLLFDVNYPILVTYGDEESEYFTDVYAIITPQMAKRWIHYSTLTDIINRFVYSVNYCYIHNCISNREISRPIFSIFTTCYNSYEKIKRAHKSIIEQAMNNWEWVILDDSPDDNHFTFLKELFQDNPKIRLYKRDKNSGNIGNVKNEVIGLCRGKYVLEMDHDDEILPYTLSDTVKVFEENPDVGFVYMDFINIYENGDNYHWGNYIGKGYAGYYCQKFRDRWAYVYISPNINNISISSLTSLPNHPRMWKRDVLYQLGSYSEFLPICDDLEILLRTAVNTKMAKIANIGYIQYMNENNNNFSLIRNGEINRIGPYFIVPQFYEMYKVNDKMKELGAYENETYLNNYSKIWKRGGDYKNVYCNYLFNLDYDKQYGIINISAFMKNIDLIRELYKDPRNDFILLSNFHENEYLWKFLDDQGFPKMKCFYMGEDTDEELVRYFYMLYKSCPVAEVFVTPDSPTKIVYNTDMGYRHQIINSHTRPNWSYLEIGVEHGETFKGVHFTNKCGVDPDPKFKHPDLNLASSDDFFATNHRSYDVIFIDGMHQAEYILRDINNSIKCINKSNGVLILDDILPISHKEQLKIPAKHYYENGILKYGEPGWTGDVWKVVYYMLLHFNDHFKFSYYNHPNYRGVMVLKNIKKFHIPDEVIDEINTYEYYEDFPKYIQMLISTYR